MCMHIIYLYVYIYTHISIDRYPILGFQLLNLSNKNLGKNISGSNAAIFGSEAARQTGAFWEG